MCAASSGQLGINIINKTTESIYRLTELEFTGQIIDFAAGVEHTVVLTSDGLYASGTAYYGEGVRDYRKLHKVNIAFPGPSRRAWPVARAARSYGRTRSATPPA